MAVVTTRTGDQLLAFEPGLALESAWEHFAVPVSFAVVIARHQGDTLLVYNTWRQEWELPAGLIHEGESPRDAAIRELYEETGQVVPEVRYIGLVLLGLPPDGRHELGAAYTCEISESQPFVANDEASAMLWWGPSIEAEGYVNAIARWLALHVEV